MKQIVKKVKCNYAVTLKEADFLRVSQTDIPMIGKIYTLKKAFYHIGYSYKTSKYALHFEELSHGRLIGYDAKYFTPVDDMGNIISKEDAIFEQTEEENPKWKIVNGKIVSTEQEIKIVEINEAHRVYVTSVIMKRWSVSQEEANSEFNRWLRNEQNSICYVGSCDNIPIATGVFDTLRDKNINISPYNTLLWVEPEFRGKNIGQRLTNKRFDWALSKGYKIIYLDTLDASEYHQKQGWEFHSKIKHKNETYTIMSHLLDDELSFTTSKKIKDFSPILKPLVADFGTVFYQTVLDWTKLIPSDKPIDDLLWDVWLVKLGHKTIGICGLYTLEGATDTSELWLGWFGIIPELRNKGLGKQVMNHLYTNAKKFGCKRIFSYVDKGGAPLNFYKREGFEVLGTVGEYCKQNGLSNLDGEDFEDKEDWVIMKTLE